MARRPTAALRELVFGSARPHVDRLLGHPVLAGPAVSIEFDDGYRSAHRSALPMLEERGWPSTHYVLTGAPDQAMTARYDELIDRDELRDLASRAEVGSHTVTHRRAPTLTDDELERELTESRRGLEAVCGRPVELFAAPFGDLDARTTAIARRTYRCQRVVGGPLNIARDFDPWTVRGRLIKDSTDDDAFADILRRARRRRAWAILVWHRVGEASASTWNVSTDAFQRQLDLIERSGVEVVATATMVERLRTLRGGGATTSAADAAPPA